MRFAMPLSNNTVLSLIAASSLAVLLGGCGGDDNDAPAPALSISGTAAVGAAIANSPVNVTCKTGTGSGTTDANGKFSVNVTNGVGPCVLSATANTGAVLRSISKGASTNINITPLSELLVNFIAIQTASGTNASPSGLASSANVANVLNNDTLFNATVGKLITSIKTQAGSDLTIPTDFLTAPLVPKSATTSTGNALDQLLDTLRTRNVTTASGSPSQTVLTAVQTEAARNVITGATGAN